MSDKVTAGMTTAAELRWRDADRSWEDIAKEVGVDVSTLRRWRQTEEWEVTFRAAGKHHMEDLAPAAKAALRRAWKDGSAQSALEVLRSLGFLNIERVGIDRPVTDEEIILLRDRLASTAE